MKLTIKGLQADIKRMREASQKADRIFQEFSNKTWLNDAERTRKLKNVEANNQNLSQAFENVKAQNTKLNAVAQKFAQDKERDAVTIATLTRLLDESVASWKQLDADFEQLAAERLPQQNAKVAR